MAKLLGAAAAALTLAIAPVPAQAQAADDAASMEAAFGMLAESFEVEPLTPEQEARLPLASEIVARIIPEGTLGEVMDAMFDSMLGPMAALAQQGSSQALAGALGYSASELGMDDAAAEEVLAIIDPAWRAREEVAAEMTQAMMNDMMASMEPLMREVMAELYAIHFDEQQLADINAFFATDTGTAYARESYRMASDPRIMAAAFSNPEVVFAPMIEAMAEMEAAMAEIPAVRPLADLSEEEVARLSELTGLTREDIDYGMQYAAESETGF